VLERLAEAAGFELQASGLAGRLSSARIDDLPLAEALPRLLGDVPYQTEYAFDAETRDHYLARLRVGEEEVAGSATAAAGELAPPANAPETARRAVTRLGERPDAAGEPRDLELEQAELMALLESPDVELRAEAAWNLEPEGEGLTRLIEVLASDPDPRVRIAATGSLENAETFAAVRALVDALNDPDPARPGGGARGDRLARVRRRREQRRRPRAPAASPGPEGARDGRRGDRVPGRLTRDGTVGS
jgi:hypothetical protein